MLALDKLSEPTILDCLPTKLSKLRLTIRDVPDGFRWKASKIPKGLIFFSLRMGPWTLDLDVPLPSTLEMFYCPGVFKGNAKLYLDALPQSVKYLSTNEVFSQRVCATNEDFESLFKKLPNLKEAIIGSEKILKVLPSGIKRLECYPDPLPINTALPSGLTSLKLLAPISSSNLKHIPATLTSLTVVGPEYRETPLLHAWSESDCAYLVDNLRLVSFSVDFKFFHSPSCMAPLAKMETLKSLFYRLVPESGMLQSPQWLPQSLPRHLRELPITFGEHQYLFEEPEKIFLSDDFLSLCKLSEVTPYLKSLKIRSWIESPVLFGKSLASLPRGLLFLEIDFDSGDLDLNAIENLPRSLRYLHLRLQVQSRQKISIHHFVGLPESLSALLIMVGSTASIDDELLTLLPKSIVSLRISSGSDGYLCTHRYNTPPFMKDNPLSKGFLYPYHSETTS